LGKSTPVTRFIASTLDFDREQWQGNITRLRAAAAAVAAAGMVVFAAALAALKQ